MNELEQKILERYMHLFALLTRHLHQLRREPALSGYSGQGRVLKFLCSSPDISQRELARALCVRSQSLGETLLKLEKNGYVTRTPSEQDRRSMIVHLTEAGRAALSDEEEGQEASPFACLSPEEQAKLDELLEKVQTHLEQAEAGRPLRRERRRSRRGLGTE